MLKARTTDDVMDDVEEWIKRSSRDFDKNFVDKDRIWVVKYFSARFLESFIKNRSLIVSSTPGFTWGDGGLRCSSEVPLFYDDVW